MLGKEMLVLVLSVMRSLATDLKRVPESERANWWMAYSSGGLYISATQSTLRQ